MFTLSAPGRRGSYGSYALTAISSICGCVKKKTGFLLFFLGKVDISKTCLTIISNPRLILRNSVRLIGQLPDIISGNDSVVFIRSRLLIVEAGAVECRGIYTYVFTES